MAQQFVSQEEFQQFRAAMNDQYEQTRKLITMQVISIDKKLKVFESQVQSVVSRKPDPSLVRDFWIRQVPKIREELQAIKIQLAKMSPKEISNG